MKQIAEYEGAFLNHLEGTFKAGERELAWELAEVLGIAVQDIKFTPTSRPIMALHFNAKDKDPTNNVVFLFERPTALQKIQDIMANKIAEDEELGEAMREYSQAAEKAPPLLPHFGIRYGSAAELKAVTDRIENGLPPRLKDRVSLWEMTRYEPIEGLPDIRQVFVRTDVFSIGTMNFEQAIELQVDRARP